MKKPFFVRFLEPQEDKAERARRVRTGVQAGKQTLKYPSDGDEGEP